MIKKLSKILGVAALLAFLVVTLAFTSIKYRDAACSKIEIEYEPDDLIAIDKAVVRKLVLNADKAVLGKHFDSINTAFLETEVEKHAAILKAEVYELVEKDSTAYRGVLKVKVKHREPIVRIMNRDASYYLDENGYKFPVSRSYPANVLVATGDIDEKYAEEQLLPFVRYIENDEFWKAQIEQVHVEKGGDIVLTPLMGDHLIELGTPENYEEKLRNMKAFYKKVLVHNNWSKYKTISLKYKDQIVAKRK